MDVSFDELYSYYSEYTKTPNNYDLFISVTEYTPNQDRDLSERQIFHGYFPYPRLFPVKDAHLFPKFMLETTGDIKNEDGELFSAPKGKYLIFDILYIYFREKKKGSLKWKRYFLFNA